MSILSIESLYQEGDEVYVSAVVDDITLVYPQTYNDPAEYGSALCESSFYIGEDTLPEDDEELIKYLNSLNLEWDLVDVSDYDE